MKPLSAAFHAPIYQENPNDNFLTLSSPLMITSNIILLNSSYPFIHRHAVSPLISLGALYSPELLYMERPSIFIH